MNVKSAIESILFIQGEPIPLARLAKAVGAGTQEVEAALRELAEEYRKRGIVLIQNDEEWQLATNPEHKTLVEKFVTSDLADELSKAGLEVLAIIAYKGPISRASIEYIRGVNSSFTLRNLLIRGLVNRKENPKDRRAYLYRISTEFLTHAGLTGLEALPHYAEFRAKNIAPPEPANTLEVHTALTPHAHPAKS